MKCLLYTLTIIMLLQTALFATINYDVPRATTVPTIDGDLSTDWEDALVITIDPNIVNAPNEGNILGGYPASEADLSADVYLKWDLDNFYVAARVYDDDLRFLQYYPGPFNGQDVFQMCFNLLNNSSAVYTSDAPIYDIAVNDANDSGPALYKHDGYLYSLPYAELNGQVLSDGYIVELRIPWGDYEYEVMPGDIHGIGFVLVDYDAFGQTVMYDYGSGASITSVSSWNTITLLGDGDCGLQGVPPGDINMDCVVDLTDLSIMASDWADCTDPANSACTDLRF